MPTLLPPPPPPRPCQHHHVPRKRMRGRRVSLLLTSALPLLAENGPFVQQQSANQSSARQTVFCENRHAETTSTAILPSSMQSSWWNTTLLEDRGDMRDSFLFPFEDGYGTVRRPRRPRRSVRWNKHTNGTSSVLRRTNAAATTTTAIVVWTNTTTATTTRSTTKQNRTTVVSVRVRNVEPTTTHTTTSSSSFLVAPNDEENSLLSSWNTSWWGETTNATEEDALQHLNVSQNVSESFDPVESLDSTSDPKEDEDSETNAIPSPSPQPAPIENTDDAVIDRVDYASKSLGALILDASPAFQGASNVLQKDNDKYAIIPCSEPSKYIIIGLSEDILVKRIVLANYERYSSHMKDIRVSASSVPGAWTELGVFSTDAAVNRFDGMPATWARYLKLEFLSHSTQVAEEHYCTITQLSVYGSTMLQGFHEQWEEEESSSSLSLSAQQQQQEGGVERMVEVATHGEEALAVVDDTMIVANVDQDPVTLEFLPHWKGTSLAPTCPVIPYLDGFQDSAADVASTMAEQDTSFAGREEQRMEIDGSALLSADVTTATLSTAEAESLPTAEELDLESVEELEARNALLSKLLHKFPNAKCLGQLQKLPLSKPPSNNLGSGSATAASPNIFTKLSAEIKSIQSTLTARDKYAREMAVCYQTILLDLLVEMDALRIDQETRIRQLEADMHAVSSLANVWWRMLDGVRWAGRAAIDQTWTVVLLLVGAVAAFARGCYVRLRVVVPTQQQQTVPDVKKKKRKAKRRKSGDTNPTNTTTKLTDVTNKPLAELRASATTTAL